MKLFYPKTGNFIAVVGNFASSKLVRQLKFHMKNAKVDVRSLKSPAFIPGVDFSDHRNYWHFNRPAVMIADTVKITHARTGMKLVQFDIILLFTEIYKRFDRKIEHNNYDC